MGQHRREILIEAPVERVFAFLSSPERLPEWMPGVRSVKRTSTGPVGVGATTETEIEIMGVRQTLLGKCLVYEPPTRLAVENKAATGIKVAGVTIGKAATVSVSELVPEGQRTRLRAALDYSLDAGMFTSIAEGMAGPQFKSDFDQSLENLKRVIEQEARAGS